MSQIVNYIIEACINFEGLFCKITALFLKKWLPVNHSKYCPYSATTFFHLSGSIRIPRRKNDSSSETIHESIHFLVS